MESACGESSSEDEEEKNRIAEIVKCLTFESECDSPLQDAKNTQESFVEIRQSSAKPSLRRFQEEEDEMTSLGSPQFRVNVARMLGELLDSLFGYESKGSGKKGFGGKGLSVAGVKLLKSSGLIDLENNNLTRKQKIEKPSRKSGRSTESSSSEDEGDMELIKQATVDGWSIIKSGGLVTSQPADLRVGVETTESEKGHKESTSQGCDQEEKPVKKKRKKSSVSEDVKSINDDDVESLKNPDKKSRKRKGKKSKHKGTDKEVESGQQLCKLPEEGEEIEMRGNCNDKSSNEGRKRKKKEMTTVEESEERTGEKVASEQQPCKLSEGDKEMKMNGNSEEKSSQKGRKRKSKKAKEKKDMTSVQENEETTEQEVESEEQPFKHEKDEEIKVNGNSEEEDKTEERQKRKSNKAEQRIEMTVVEEGEEPVKKKRKSKKKTGSETVDHPSGIASEKAKADGIANLVSGVPEDIPKKKRRKRNKNRKPKVDDV